MSRQTIWNKLIDLGFSENASAALMGNWEAESNCEACRVQGDFSTDRSQSQTYATTVNNGGSSAFVYDSRGWGLAQWTYWSRKQGLYDFCQTKGKGIEDEETQVEFAYQELSTEYTGVLTTLKSNTSLYLMVESVCKDYERPAVNNVSYRYTYAQDILSKFQNTHTAGTTTTTTITQTETTTGTTASVTSNTTAATFSTYCFPEMPICKQGDKGIPVGMAQYALNKHGFSTNIDCDFGSLTANALKLFQAHEGITTSGVVDKATWEALYK